MPQTALDCGVGGCKTAVRGLPKTGMARAVAVGVGVGEGVFVGLGVGVRLGGGGRQGWRMSWAGGSQSLLRDDDGRSDRRAGLGAANQHQNQGKEPLVNRFVHLNR